MLTRRSTPQVLQKLGKNPRDREREWEEERWWEDERESFPQFWCVSLLPAPPARKSLGDVAGAPRYLGLTWHRSMTCEKQFIPQDQKVLYCSEA